MSFRRTRSLAQQTWTALHQIHDDFAQRRWLRELEKEASDRRHAELQAKIDEIRARIAAREKK